MINEMISLLETMAISAADSLSSYLYTDLNFSCMNF